MQIKDMTTRQKITIGAFTIVVIFLIWQVYGMFNEGSAPAPIGQKPAGPMAQSTSPIAAPLPKKPVVLSEREIFAMKLQQQTEEKYLLSLNELQMLKLQRDIALTNKDIATAKFDTVTAQKNTIDLLTKPVLPEAAYAQGLTRPVSAPATMTPPVPVPVPVSTSLTEVNYVVISVTQLQQRWNAVLGYQGKLFTISIGDVLPPDGSKVISIDRSGVTLEKDSTKKKISLVPVI